MKSAFLLPLLLLVPALQATEADMNKALARWEQQMTEYNAALEVASTPEQRNSILPPNGSEVAARLWKAVSAKTGTRKVLIQPTLEDKAKGAKPTQRQVSTYEFEQPWAAPAVAWFLCHPNEFAQVLADKPRQQSFFAEALLDSVERIHFSNPAIQPACAALLNGSTRKSYDILKKIFVRNGDASAKASAALALAIMLGDPLISGAEGTPAQVRANRIFYLKQAANLAPEDAMFGKVHFDEALGELAYVLGHLSEGAVPPQMQLTDSQGQAATLPQPGKAHLLYFWAPSNDAAFRAVAHMESVKQSYPDLVICPITAHQPDSAEWASQLVQYGISTCYTDDEKTTAAQAYRITQVPTAVLVDTHCHILYIGAPGLELQTAILKLTTPETPAKPVTPGKGKGQKVYIEDPTAIQPGARPDTNQDDKDDAPPALRDMPEF